MYAPISEQNFLLWWLSLEATTTEMSQMIAEPLYISVFAGIP